MDWRRVLGFFLGVAVSTASAAEAPVQVYFGNLHAHTAASDGAGTAEEAFAYARDVAGLDFLAVTEHNHLLGGAQATAEQRTAIYVGPAPSAILPTARRMTQDGVFVALSGQEFSTMSKGNHVNVFDVPAVIDVPSGDFAALLRWLEAHPDSTGHPAVLQLNHPMLGVQGKTDFGLRDFGRDDFGGHAGWVRAMGGASSLVEVLNGEPPPDKPGTRAPQQMEHFYLLFLQLGFRVAPTGNQDNHRPNWGTATEARTAILAPELTTAALLTAMRARHVYATEDRNLAVFARVNGALCGNVLRAPSSPTLVTLSLDDPDEPDAEYRVEVLRGEVGGPLAQVVETQTVRGRSGIARMEGPWLTKAGDYLFLRITHSGAEPDRVWTAPVWWDASDGAP